MIKTKKRNRGHFGVGMGIDQSCSGKRGAGSMRGAELVQGSARCW